METASVRKHGFKYWLNKRRRRDILLAFLLLFPTLYILVKTFVYPIIQSLIWSFYKYHLLDGSQIEFVRFQNYLSVLTDHSFWVAMYYTGYFTVISTFLEILFGFFSALLLNQMFRGQRFFRVIILLPWAMVTLVNGLLWKWIYQPGYGAMNVVLEKLHILAPGENLLWLSHSQGIINSVIVADVWKMTPYMTLLLLAGMQTIQPNLYESAMMDGAGFWKKIWYITIPQLKPMLIIAVVIRVIGAFRVYDILTVFTGDPTTSVSYLTFNIAFRYFYLGKASAMAWISTLFILVVIVFYIRALKKSEQ